MPRLTYAAKTAKKPAKDGGNAGRVLSGHRHTAVMKQLLYLHARVTPLIVVVTKALNGILSRRIAPLLLRLMPGRRGRQITLILMWSLGLTLQAIMLWLLGELVSLCIGLYELWAILAGRFVEIDN